MKTFERRMAVSGLEVRESADALTLTGYASTFSQPYDMGWYTEQVDPEAFNRTLSQKPDVRLLINHDGLPLARTASGTLTLSADSTGLLASASLDRSDPDVASLAPKMARGDVNAMSFGFRIVPNAKGEPGDAWSPDMSSRTLRTIDLDGGDVSVVTYPANPNTSVSVRSAGTAFEAITSAMRAMELRGAPDEEIRELLARMQAAFGGIDLAPAVPAVAPVVQETSDGDEARYAFRKRQALLLSISK